MRSAMVFFSRFAAGLQHQLDIARVLLDKRLNYLIKKLQKDIKDANKAAKSSNNRKIEIALKRAIAHLAQAIPMLPAYPKLYDLAKHVKSRVGDEEQRFERHENSAHDVFIMNREFESKLRKALYATFFKVLFRGLP